MRKSKMKTTRRIRGVGLLVPMAFVLAAVSAVPATADHSPPPASPLAGSGTLHGTELSEDQVFLGQPCFAATRIIFGLRGEGTYHGRTAGGETVAYRAQLAPGQPTYEGPIHIEVENTEPFHHGPYGTHGGDSACTAATAGTPVPAKFRICSPRPLTFHELGQPVEECVAAQNVYKVDAGGAHVPCTGTGSYVRKGMTGENWHADWTLDESCVVVGNDAGTPGQGLAPRGTTQTHVGSHAPCGGTCADNIKVNFAQYLPPPGLAVSVGGPAGAPIGQTVTLTAGVTADGAPLTGAPVIFSVTGPGPGAPPAATVPTGTDGRAEFTLTGAIEGDYVVTASTTWPTYPGSVVSDTHTVHFSAPAPRIVLDGLARSATEDPMTVTATIVDDSNPIPGEPAHDPVPGVPVAFTVTGTATGQATPASATAVTDLNGEATFTFVGARAGAYTVAASVSYAGRSLSATHDVRLDVKTLSRVGAIDDAQTNSGLASALIDPAGRFAYFGTTDYSGRVIKVDLSTFERVGVLTLDIGEGNLGSAVIDPAGKFAYFGTNTSLRLVVKVDLTTFQRVGAITLLPGETNLTSAIIDPSGTFAYFATADVPARVVKVDLATFQRVSAITLAQGENTVRSAVIDPAGTAAYFGTNTVPGRVVKVDLNSFQRVRAVTLLQGEDQLTSAVIDPDGAFAYFGSFGSLVKVDLATFQRSSALKLPSNVASPTSALIDTAGQFAYFGARVDDRNDYFRFGPGAYLSAGAIADSAYSAPAADGVLKVALDNFELRNVLALAAGEESLTSAVIAPGGSNAYFGTTPPAGGVHPADDLPSKVVKTSLIRPPSAALVAANDSYAADYLTMLSVPAPGVLANDGPGLTAGPTSDPAGGQVNLNDDGSFTYSPDPGFSGAE
jgi:hypothetical protein